MSTKPTKTSQSSEGAAASRVPSTSFQVTSPSESKVVVSHSATPRPIIPLRSPTRTPTKGNILTGSSPTKVFHTTPLRDPTRKPNKKRKAKGSFRYIPTKASDHLFNFTPTSSASQLTRPSKRFKGVRFTETGVEYDSVAALLAAAVGTSADPYAWYKPTPNPQPDAFKKQELSPK